MDKEYLIALNRREISAALEGRLTQLRRPIRSRYDWYMDELDGASWPFYQDYVFAEPDPIPMSFPYGSVGDVLRGIKFSGMPKETKTLSFENVNIRVEKLEDVSWEDAAEEGFNINNHLCRCDICIYTAEMCPASASSMILELIDEWKQRFNKKGVEDNNPWTWVISIRRCNV